MASLLTTNSPRVSIAGTVSVPFGFAPMYCPCEAYTTPPFDLVIGSSIHGGTLFLGLGTGSGRICTGTGSCGRPAGCTPPTISLADA